MRFNSSVEKYLLGKDFSNGLEVVVAEKESVIPDRITRLESIALGKKVIHLGCVDHMPMLEQKIKNNTWLHARLSRVATRCMGIDINHEGIELLKHQLNYRDVVCADLLRDDVYEIKSEEWDYVILGEILEHVDNPVAFLKELVGRYSDNIRGLIVTVPNAFSLANFLKALSHKEFINTDHRYWFTPYTLGKVITRADLEVVKFEFCESLPSGQNLSTMEKVSGRGILFKYILRSYPIFRETLLLEARF